jgi:uncharacterized damage-inducible protein DinB
MSEITRIIDELSREYDGDPWHGSSLAAILEGVTAEQASAIPVADAHSIWELVLHVTAWKNEVRSRVSGAPAGAPREGDWPAVGDPSELRWAAARERLHRAHRDLLAAIAEVPEARLDAPTSDPREQSPGAGVSHYVLLHGAVQHDVYHAGQIALVKKALARTASRVTAPRGPRRAA